MNWAGSDPKVQVNGDDDGPNGRYSTVPGGSFNKALGIGSFACGTGAHAKSHNSAVFGFDKRNVESWMDEKTTCTDHGDETFTVCAPGGVYIGDENIMETIASLKADIERLTGELRELKGEKTGDEMEQIIDDSTSSAVDFEPVVVESNPQNLRRSEGLGSSDPHSSTHDLAELDDNHHHQHAHAGLFSSAQRYRRIDA